jgi:hypothetical protein
MLADACAPERVADVFRSFIKGSGLRSLLIAGVCLVIVLVLIRALRSDSSPRPASPQPLIFEGSPHGMMPVYSPFWELTPTGPTLTDEFARNVLNLRPEQTAGANKALKAIYQDALNVESRNSEWVTDGAGRVSVAIRPYPVETMQLEDRLWSELDAILDPKQQDLARLNLKLEPRKLPSSVPLPNSELAGPGFFGWGKDGARIEVWRVGSWYRWRVRSRGSEDSSTAPQLPAGLRRFWKESPAE